MNKLSSMKSEEIPVRQPGVLLLHLLNKCNLRCKHCYMDASLSGASLQANLVIRSINEVVQIEELNVSSVHLSGGEPLLYSQLPLVLDSLRNLKIHVSVSTNGTLIGENEVELFKRNGVNVQVSIDGPREYHDSFRGLKGVFQRASTAIEQMVNAGVSVSLVTTVCKDNLSWLPWLAQWASEKGVNHVTLQPLSQMGRGVDLGDKRLSNSQLCDLFLSLSDLSCRYRCKKMRFTLAYHTRQFLLAHPCAVHACSGSKCHRKVTKEIRKLVIREDGTVLPEVSTLDYRFAVGNINNAPLTDLLPNYFATGYSDFVSLCKSTYEEIMPNWSEVFVPWDEIIAERSKIV